MAKKKDNAMLPLDEPRVLTLKTAKTEFVYRTRRVTSQDWLEYYQGVVHQVIQRGNDREQIIDSETPLIELVDRILSSVEGYGDLKEKENWRDLLPVRHRTSIGICLLGVGVQKAQQGEEILSDLVEVKLNATWSCAGKTVFYSGLIHRLRQPSIQQLAYFNRESSRVSVRGDAEYGVTVYPSRHAIAMKLYDELVESVDGYSVNGEPLVGKEAISREMDGAHKAAVALEIFAGGDEITVA